ncbi:hypothetical protein Ciccas_012236 [Cichlidogyrus casuarinus]|uniref:Uncharacterized protein n=1 Tax=Cichlidogyrus casuarinus TaxID=1844966 RepID=A0ABD2PP04_9PLAT
MRSTGLRHISLKYPTGDVTWATLKEAIGKGPEFGWPQPTQVLAIEAWQAEPPSPPPMKKQNPAPKEKYSRFTIEEKQAIWRDLDAKMSQRKIDESTSVARELWPT